MRMERDIAVLRSKERAARKGASRSISGGYLVLSLSACQPSDEPVPVPYHVSDQILVDRAIAIYSGGGRITKDKAMEEVYPVVVHLPDRSCVGLNLRPGMAGGDTTICFRRSDGELILNYVNGA